MNMLNNTIFHTHIVVISKVTVLATVLLTICLHISISALLIFCSYICMNDSLSYLLLEFQKRVLFLMTDIKSIVKDLGHWYELPDSCFHLKTIQTREEFLENEERLDDESEKQLLVGLINWVILNLFIACMANLNFMNAN